MTTPTDINTNLSTVTVQELLDYTEFTNGLVDKLAGKLAKLNGDNIDVAQFSTKLASKFATAEQLAKKADKTALDEFAKLDGTNATDTGVAAMLGKLADKVVTTKELTAETAKLANKDGSDINVDSISTKLASKFATAEQLNTKANTIGDNIDVEQFSTKLASKLATAEQLNTKANTIGDNIDVAQFSNKLTTASDSTIKTALEGKANTSDLANKVDKNDTTTFVKLDGANIADHTDAGKALVDAILAVKAANSDDKTNNKTLIQILLDEKLALKADKTDLDGFARLDGTNADQGAKLLKAILNVKSSDDPKKTILEERLAKTGAVDVGQFVKIDGTNAVSHSDNGVGLAKAIFNVKDNSSGETILVSELADKFAAAGSTSGGRPTVEIDSTDTLPDAWANLI
ncbi:Hypothetical protein CINCED_3A019753 [Cinara cedri]|uniref:Uncharacterized protein n=1 Tax=Cinara cedri TaxID=506608 RepID=A0A5E4NRS2_9HEMI|nr:Hypothetical protein CINCED_3A019753 [Cinara cedri]